MSLALAGPAAAQIYTGPTIMPQPDKPTHDPATWPTRGDDRGYADSVKTIPPTENAYAQTHERYKLLGVNQLPDPNTVAHFNKLTQNFTDQHGDVAYFNDSHNRGFLPEHTSEQDVLYYLEGKGNSASNTARLNGLNGMKNQAGDWFELYTAKPDGNPDKLIGYMVQVGKDTDRTWTYQYAFNTDQCKETGGTPVCFEPGQGYIFKPITGPKDPGNNMNYVKVNAQRDDLAVQSISDTKVLEQGSSGLTLSTHDDKDTKQRWLLRRVGSFTTNTKYNLVTQDDPSKGLVMVNASGVYVLAVQTIQNNDEHQWVLTQVKSKSEYTLTSAKDSTLFITVINGAPVLASEKNDNTQRWTLTLTLSPQP